MGYTVRQVIKVMEEIAPSYLAEEWDNVGLLVGGLEDEVRKVMVCLDVTEDIVYEAVRKGANMLISHHPVIFEKLRSLRSDVGRERLVYLLARNGIAAYCAHTNLDKVSGGVDDVLAARLGLQDVKPLSVDQRERLYKIVVFIPKGHEDRVMDAMAGAGAGWIGNYSHCTFQINGTGTFMPLEGTNPYIGQQGRLERVEEVRLETIVSANRLDRVIKAMLEVHPYEEVAYDVYPLANRIEKHGLGRIGKLQHSMLLKEFVDKVCNDLGVSNVQVAGWRDTEIQTVAICGGAGGSLISKAYSSGAQVFLTGELKYHEAQAAAELGMVVIAVGHYPTEVFIVQELVYRLQKAFDALKYEIEVFAAETMSDIYKKVGR
ncbi:dinuclear metal center YbgI/SA1388 family protein [Caldicoprobacter guelmensis]|uniref:Nif3-like dinuclear metal center hexameric protein n=1 Tax=Caldicoprobacter guelmensis TaxID=1170224 RepID=UPI00195EF4E0|nr:Nif3-like dinuclear metal center hexameric protein [Caldicoprobacter guelmensis]MBM7581843.1 dinuclear metal center YbgI/SA1388 family protein [Caldicoprobacter guelmensis]